MQDEQPIAGDRGQGEGAAVVVGELDQHRGRIELLDHRADLAAHEPFRWPVVERRYDFLNDGRLGIDASKRSMAVTDSTLLLQGRESGWESSAGQVGRLKVDKPLNPHAYACSLPQLRV